MKAAQIRKYSKSIAVEVNDIPIPEIGDNEVLVKVKVAAVNPVNGAAAPVTKSRLAGKCPIAPASIAAYSAKAPIFVKGSREYMASPTLNPFTFLPIFSITPVSSLPSVNGNL